MLSRGSLGAYDDVVRCWAAMQIKIRHEKSIVIENPTTQMSEKLRFLLWHQGVRNNTTRFASCHHRRGVGVSDIP